MKQIELKFNPAAKTMVFNNRKGFTLIELLVTIVFVSVTLAAMATLLAASIRGGQQTKHTTATVALVQDKIEEFKQASFASLTSGSETGIDSEGNSGGPYDRTWTVTTSGSTKEIVVTVSWPFNGVTKSTSLTTIISN